MTNAKALRTSAPTLPGDAALDSTIAALGGALEREPTRPDLAVALAEALRTKGLLDEAGGLLELALALKPDFAATHLELGNLARARGDSLSALGAYARAAAYAPGAVEPLCSRALALKDLGQLDDAIGTLEDALARAPDNVDLHYNLANCRYAAGDLEGAASGFEAVLARVPEHCNALINRGLVHRDQGDADAAVACFDRVIALRPDHPAAHWNRSLALLLAGDFERGWPEYEWRWHATGMRLRNFQAPLWDGKVLDGKTILLHAEQGARRHHSVRPLCAAGRRARRPRGARGAAGPGALAGRPAGCRPSDHPGRELAGIRLPRAADEPAGAVRHDHRRRAGAGALSGRPGERQEAARRRAHRPGRRAAHRRRVGRQSGASGRRGAELPRRRSSAAGHAPQCAPVQPAKRQPACRAGRRAARRDRARPAARRHGGYRVCDQPARPRRLGRYRDRASRRRARPPGRDHARLRRRLALHAAPLGQFVVPDHDALPSGAAGRLGRRGRANIRAGLASGLL